MTRLLAAFAIGYLTLWQEPNVQRGPRLQGTFLQFRLDQQWDAAKLRGLFLNFRRIGLSEVVVQWTVAANRAFYRSTAFAVVPEEPLEPLLKLADEFGIR